MKTRLASRIMALVFAMILLSALLTGCVTNSTPPPTQPTTAPEPTTSPSLTTTSAAPLTNLPVHTRLKLSQAPRLGETAELEYSASLNVQDLLGIGKSEASLVNSRAWLEFVHTRIQGSYAEAKYGVKVPAEKVVLSGNSTWSGSGLENRDIKLDATIQFPEEGYWIIYGRFTGENWTAPYESRMAVVVTRDAAGVVGTPEFNSGPLARFGDFSYGEPAKPSPSELHPVTIELDISKPPRAGEEATITYRIDSLNDISDFSTELRFFRRSGERVSADKLLVKGEAITELDLKAGVPAEISATVVFPDADDWRIAVYGVSPENIREKTAGAGDGIELTVASDIGSFGWKYQKIMPSPPPSGISTVTALP